MFNDLRNHHHEHLDATWTQGSADPDHVVLIGHGVTANKDRPWARALADALAVAGLSSLRFSFAGNGASEGDFADATITKEVEDLGVVLDAVTDAGLAASYIGHSMGAAVGVLRASRDPRIRHLVSLAGMVDTAGFAARKFGHLRPGADCMWDKPECPLSQAFLDDLRAVGTVASQAAAINVPWLLVHGDADTVVPLKDSRDVLEAHRMQSAASAAGQGGGRDEAGRVPGAAGRPAPGLHVLPGADHVFSDGASAAMCAVVVAWLSGFLRPGTNPACPRGRPS